MVDFRAVNARFDADPAQLGAVAEVPDLGFKPVDIHWQTGRAGVFGGNFVHAHFELVNAAAQSVAETIDSTFVPGSCDLAQSRVVVIAIIEGADHINTLVLGAGAKNTRGAGAFIHAAKGQLRVAGELPAAVTVIRPLPQCRGGTADAATSGNRGNALFHHQLFHQARRYMMQRRGHPVWSTAVDQHAVNPDVDARAGHAIGIESGR